MKCTILLFATFCGIFATPLKQDDAALKEFLAGNKLFTAGIYKGIVSGTSGNLIVSPFSVETVLAMTYKGAKGVTATELVSGLSLPSTDEKIEQAFKSLLPKMKGSSESGLVFATANKVYVKEGVELEQDFASVAKSVFHSEVGTVNFAEPKNAADEINAWVESKTNNKIQNLVDPSSLTEQTSIILVNALYLSGEWKNMFVSYLPAKNTFYKTEVDTIQTYFMHEEQYFNYYENKELDAKFLQLALEGGDVHMVVALPNKAGGLSSLEQNLDKVLEPQPYTVRAVVVDLPKFSIRSEIGFVPVLEKLGVRSLFNVNADLSGISSTHKDLFVNNVMHKAFINVTEYGLEAAAATEVDMDVSVVLDEFADFKADHPFLYYIVNDGVVVFAGRYVDPSE